jgi:hypothetical protein
VPKDFLLNHFPPVSEQGAWDMLAPNWPETDHLHNIGNRSILALHFWRYLGQLIDHFKLRFFPGDYFLVALKPRDAPYIAFNCLDSPIPSFSLGIAHPWLPLGTAAWLMSVHG